MKWEDYFEQEAKKYNVNVNVNLLDYDEEEFKDVIDYNICLARQRRNVENIVKRFTISVGLNGTEWVCETQEKTLFGVYSDTEKSFSVEDVRMLAKFVNALYSMGYEINGETINKLMTEMYCGLFYDEESEFYNIHIEDMALEYLGVA